MGTDGSLPRQRALALTNLEPGDGARGVAGALQRLCRAVTQDLELTGATVTLVPDVGSHSVAAASSQAIRRSEELQFDAGEGPTRDAYNTGQPVVIADLSLAMSRWPGYRPAALAAGVESLISLPLKVGAAKLGALSSYWMRPGAPNHDVLRVALVFADLATELLIDSSYSQPGDGLDLGLHASLETHAHIYQAQGMVMVDLDVPLPEALARMRAHAYSTGQDLSSVASQIVGGKSVLTRDPA